jgi:NADH-quinone oxidoreductase subunit L
MVTAGVYLVARSSEIFVHAPAAMVVVAVVGALTALFAATIGLAQWDIKKVLAYSTVSQLGYMFLACGVGAFGAGVFHVITHAFFKALLFLGSGSVIIGMHHEQDMRRMGGLRKYMPITHATMAVGWLAICGVPIFSGFFSKDEILYQTANAHWMPAGLNWVLWGIGALTALITAVYMTRLMVLTFWTPERYGAAHGDPKEKLRAEDAQGVGAHAGGHHADDHDLGADAKHDHHDDDADAHHHGLAPGQKPHETPAVMWAPLVVLAVLAAVGGLLNVPEALFGNSFLHDRVLHSAIAVMPSAAAAEHESHALELMLAGVSTAIALLGILVGFLVFRRSPLREMPRLFENKWYVDELYDAALVRPVNALSRTVLWRAVDVNIIDWAVNGVGRLVRGSGGAMRGLQSGLVRGYVAVILFGAVVVIAYFTFFGMIAR